MSGAVGVGSGLSRPVSSVSTAANCCGMSERGNAGHVSVVEGASLTVGGTTLVSGGTDSPDVTISASGDVAEFGCMRARLFLSQGPLDSPTRRRLGPRRPVEVHGEAVGEREAVACTRGDNADDVDGAAADMAVRSGGGRSVGSVSCRRSGATSREVCTTASIEGADARRVG